jgi:hypothetical protein
VQPQQLSRESKDHRRSDSESEDESKNEKKATSSETDKMAFLRNKMGASS